MPYNNAQKPGVCKILISQVAPTHVRPAWQGQARLIYTRQGDRTLPEVQTQAPLKVQRPFYPIGDDACHSVLLHTAGGMVGGDRLSYDIALQPTARALITTAAAAKIYTDHPQPAHVQGTLRVASGGCLEWLPQEAIVFEGAQYHQTLRVDLAADAHWLGWDILRLGRTARGERFTRGEVRSRCEVWHNGHLIWVDAQQLKGSETLWNSPHGLAQCPVIATLAWVGALPDAAVVAAIRDNWVHLPNPQGEAGVTRLQLGLLCRYRGHSTGAARRWFTQVWERLRPLYAQQAVTRPRVWQRD